MKKLIDQPSPYCKCMVTNWTMRRFGNVDEAIDVFLKCNVNSYTYKRTILSIVMQIVV